jgi:hypothetical protein
MSDTDEHDGCAVVARDYRNWKDFRRACKAMDFLGLGYRVDATGGTYFVTLIVRDERDDTNGGTP